MRNVTVTSSLVIALLAAILLIYQNFEADAHAQTNQRTPGTKLLSISNPTNTGTQLILVDPDSKHISVYSVDSGSGKITLKSSRNVYWDFHVDEFNATSPTPREIQSLIR